MMAIGVFLVLVFLNLTIGAWCLEYTVEFWASFIKGYPVDIPFWGAMLAAFPLGPPAIPAAALTWLSSFMI